MPYRLQQFISELFKALGHPARIRILEHLRTGERTVSELQALLEIESSTVSQQLALMRSRYTAFARGDEVLPTFVAAQLPPAAAGFILAAIVAAALSPSLNSMASVTLRDFYLPYVRPHAGDREQVRVGKAFTVVWGLAQIAVALAAQGLQKALDSGLAVLGYASGPTVGAYPCHTCAVVSARICGSRSAR